MRNIVVTIGAGLLLSGLPAPPPASAEEIKDFYKGKEITLYVGYRAGGGYDRYSRTLARHLGRHIPGSPRIIVKNRPGAASLLLANGVYKGLRQDGTAIANVGRAIATESLLGNGAARFDARRFTWLGSMNNEVNVCVVWHTVPVSFWNDLTTRGAVLGGTGAGSDTDNFPLVLNNILGTKFKLITGYPSGNDINAAMESGVLEGRCAWSWASINSTRPELLKDKRIKLLAQLSTTKHPAMLDVPLVTEFATSKKDLQTLKLIFSRQLWGRPYMIGPNVPKARGKALRAAFARTMKDAAFLKDANRQKLEVNWVDGAVLQNTLSRLYDYPEDVIAAAVKAQTDRSKLRISKAVIKIETNSGKITRLQSGNRRVSWEGEKATGEKTTGKIRVRAGHTAIQVNGKKINRAALKVGMSCKFTYQASLARNIDCE
jgi:tripartite-type tricarboxylate transporter receptor subunit TctC